MSSLNILVENILPFPPCMMLIDTTKEIYFRVTKIPF